MTRTVRKSDLASAMFSSGRFPAEIANSLRVSESCVRDWLRLPPAPKPRLEDVTPNALYARLVSGTLRFKTLEGARLAVERLSELYGECRDSGDLAGKQQITLLALLGKCRAETLGKPAIAQQYRHCLLNFLMDDVTEERKETHASP